MRNFGKYRLTLVIVGLFIIIGASLPPFMTASCQTRQQTPAELRALESLRSMTHNVMFPADDVVARIETQFPRTRAAALARLVRARIKVKAKDYAGAASLLDSNLVRDHSLLGDYALFIRANALEQTGRAADARVLYAQIARDYPASSRARDASLDAARIMLANGDTAGAIRILKTLADKDDGAALFVTARAHEQASDPTRASGFYRRTYFYAPAAAESSEAATALTRLGNGVAPQSAAEAMARADALYYAKKFSDAAQAYGDAFARFPTALNSQAQLRRVIAAANSRKTAEAASALNTIPASEGQTRAEALNHVAQVYARSRQWEQVRATIDDLRRQHPGSEFTPRAMTAVGQIAKEAKNEADASYFSRLAVSSYPDSIEVAQAQFDLAWKAHESRNFAESSKLLTEHLALYADKNTDNRGRAGYWAARDSERAGKLAEARALYQGVLARYDANWYGYLAKQRQSAMLRGGVGTIPAKSFSSDSMVGRAVANLETVTVAEETAGPAANQVLAKADELNIVGLDDWAFEELATVNDAASSSPKVNLAIARVFRSQDKNIEALNVLKKSFPDYSQMKPEELTREEWDVFYPLSHWEIISQESRARNLDAYQVAGLIRQETVFVTRARSHAKAYGLMQLLIPTAISTARKYGIDRSISEEALYEPRLNIQLGTAYLRDQIDKFGKIEYVAAAYNAGPGRAVQWRASLPTEMDEWAEAVPFKETRGYVQGVVRNRLQYLRLYDEHGRFRPEVGSRAVTKQSSASATPGPEAENSNVRKHRVSGNEGGE